MLAHGRPLAPILRGAGADFQRLFADVEQGRGDVLKNASSTSSKGAAWKQILAGEMETGERDELPVQTRGRHSS